MLSLDEGPRIEGFAVELTPRLYRKVQVAMILEPIIIRTNHLYTLCIRHIQSHESKIGSVMCSSNNACHIRGTAICCIVYGGTSSLDGWERSHRSRGGDPYAWWLTHLAWNCRGGHRRGGSWRLLNYHNTSTFHVWRQWLRFTHMLCPQPLSHP